MADYFTQFSVVLKMDSKEQAEKALEIFETALESGFFAEEGEAPEFSDAGFDVSEQEGNLWINDGGGNGNVESVEKFVLHLAKELNLTGLWGFTYASTCNKPKLDGFAGGAVLLDLGKRELVDWVNAAHWLQTKLEAAPGATS